MAEPTIVQFVVLPNATRLDVVLGMEVLRFANVVSGRPLFDASIVSSDPRPVPLSDGDVIVPQATIDEAPRPDVAIVIGGHPPPADAVPPYNSWLRKLARSGIILGGVDWGVVVLAEAGLLEDCRVAAHWEVTARLLEHPGTLKITEDLYAFDRNRITCAGRCAITEMMLYLIHHLYGANVAVATGQDLVYSCPRPANTPQKLSHGLSPSTADRRLAKCLAAIEANPETPLSLVELAKRAGVSPRYLQKLAQRELGISIMEYSLSVRLSKARDLVLHTDMPMFEIAAATGFSAAAVFARAFKQRYGKSARLYRTRYRQSRARPFALGSPS
jgi:AraC family carnitine catabolism transcriptional activator